MSIVRNYEDTVISLLKSKPFFAKLIMSMRKDFTFPMPTVGVSVTSGGINLHINPEFFNDLTPEARVAILEHEVLHVVHSHLARFKKFGIQDQGLANVACDLAINQYIQNLPETINIKDKKTGEIREGKPVTYDAVKKQIPDLLPRMSSEYYFNKLKTEQEKQKKQGKDPGDQGGNELTDDHGEWDKSDLTEEQQEKFVKSHVKAVLDTCSDKEKAMLDKTIIDELYKSDVDWRAQLRSFFANSEETFTETTRKKRNRRYGILQAGNKNEPKIHLGICVDTSGSISDTQLKMFFGEVARIYNEHTMVLHVIEADCVVRNVYTYKKNMKISAAGRSGTAYQPALTKCKELRVDACIYMGDMDISDTPTKPKFPVLWAICGQQKSPVAWGKSLYLK